MSSTPVVPPSKPLTVVISEWRSIDRNTLLGAFTLTLPSGMVIDGCMAHRKGDQEWIALPGSPQIDRDGNLRRNEGGKPAYKTLIKFTSKQIYDRFQEPVLKELRRLGHI
jgi:hypothetical protein